MLAAASSLLRLTFASINRRVSATMAYLQHLPQLTQKRIILASASPRRKELLGNLGLKFEIVVSTFDEKLPKGDFPSGAAYATETARQKALDVHSICKQQGKHVDLLISADTVVEDPAGLILEKPDDDEHAFRMLSSLVGTEHHVHTGVVLVVPGAKDPSSGEGPLVRAFSETTAVTFDQLSDATLRAYIATGEPFGKAGSYGIQGHAGAFVVGIKGCYFNVVGFPVHRFCKELEALLAQGSLQL